MTRRDALLATGALLAAGAGHASPAELSRGLWRDDLGVFGVGAFPEFGKGLFGFDYATRAVGPLRLAAEHGWDMAGSLDGGAPGAETVRLDRAGRLIVGARRLSPVRIERRPFMARSGGGALSAEAASVRGAPVRGVVLMIYGSGPAPKEAFDPWAL